VPTSRPTPNTNAPNTNALVKPQPTFIAAKTAVEQGRAQIVAVVGLGGGRDEVSAEISALLDQLTSTRTVEAESALVTVLNFDPANPTFLTLPPQADNNDEEESLQVNVAPNLFPASFQVNFTLNSFNKTGNLRGVVQLTGPVLR
jgi:hypothetical protein